MLFHDLRLWKETTVFTMMVRLGFSLIESERI